MPIARRLGITDTTAEILDDIHILTLSISSHPRCSPQMISDLAASLYSKIESLKLQSMPDSDAELLAEQLHIESTVRSAALIYTSSIYRLQFFSAFDDKSVQKSLVVSLLAVNLTRWKQIPGILLFTLLCAVPWTSNELEGRFIRRKMAVTGLSIGLEDFDLSISYLRSFWLVQRWILEQQEPQVAEAK